MTEEEKEEWDRIEGIRDGFQEECKWLAEQIEKETDPDLLRLYEQDLERAQKILARAKWALEAASE